MPETDQCSINVYKTRDLQIASVANAVTLAFPMTHKMGLIQINLNTKSDVMHTKYTISSTGYTFYNWHISVTGSDQYSSTKKPYRLNSSTHYFITALNTSSSFTTTSTIAATADAGNEWTESANVLTAGTLAKINITPATTYIATGTYTPAIGDIFYAESGALTHSYDVNYGTPVGLVYNLSTTTKDNALGYKNGYVVALKKRFSQSDRFSIDVTWATGSARTTQVTDQLLTTGNVSYILNDRDGLTHCLHAKNNYAVYATECNVMLKASDFADMAPLPETGTSGWYVPSTGQCYDWLLTLTKTYGGNGADGLITTSTNWGAGSVDDRWPTYFINNFGAATSSSYYDRMNGWFTGKNIPSTYYDVWESAQYYWTSTEIKPDVVYTLDCPNATHITWQGTTNWKKSYTDRYLRCVLAF